MAEIEKLKMGRIHFKTTKKCKLFSYTEKLSAYFILAPSYSSMNEALRHINRFIFQNFAILTSNDAPFIDNLMKFENRL